MESSLIEKLQKGRPVSFTEEEEGALIETLRQAMANTLEASMEEVSNDARIFDTLGVDSIDVFDILDQLAEKFEVDVPLEELPESFVRGGEDTTFLDFANGLIRFFGTPPRSVR